MRQDNRHSAKLLDLIGTYDPDIFFAVEIDHWWEEQLKAIAARYPRVTSVPQDNGYGFVFMTRLMVEACEARRLVRPEIPSLKARLALPSGKYFWFYGVHPEPPGPIQAPSSSPGRCATTAMRPSWREISTAWPGHAPHRAFSA